MSFWWKQRRVLDAAAAAAAAAAICVWCQQHLLCLLVDKLSGVTGLYCEVINFKPNIYFLK